MRNFAILGYPLGHSLSPQLHSRLFALSGHEVDYQVLELSPEDLQAPQSIARLRALDGFNVTIPHKAAIIPLLDSLDETAQLYGAVNTVQKKGSKLIGYNTDVDGFLGVMRGSGTPLTGTVCIIGAAGGAGRMFATTCALQGATLTLAVREGAKAAAQELADSLTAKGATPPTVCLTEELAGPFDLLINASPVGMYPLVDAMPVPETLLGSIATVFDCVYNPVDTLLLQKAAAAGCKCVGGMPMLVWQAAAGHKIWDGACYSDAALLTICKDLEAQISC